MNLPEICPECGVNLKEDTTYYVHGIQYCYGAAFEFNEDGTVTLDELDGGDWSVEPYEITCGECEYVLWEKSLIVNEEKFFVEKGEENEV